jgi:hypothetical protein
MTSPFLLQLIIPYIQNVETICRTFEVLGQHRIHQVDSISVPAENILLYAFTVGYFEILRWMQHRTPLLSYADYIGCAFPYKHLHIIEFFRRKGYPIRIDETDLSYAIRRRDQTTLEWIERHPEISIWWSDLAYSYAWPRKGETVQNSFVINWLYRNHHRNVYKLNRSWKRYLCNGLHCRKVNRKVSWHEHFCLLGQVELDAILKGFKEVGICVENVDKRI